MSKDNYNNENNAKQFSLLIYYKLVKHMARHQLTSSMQPMQLPTKPQYWRIAAQRLDCDN